MTRGERYVERVKFHLPPDEALELVLSTKPTDIGETNGRRPHQSYIDEIAFHNLSENSEVQERLNEIKAALSKKRRPKRRS
ncbi:MAG: hypothetical protein AAB909_02165 [Patescibacteria group bacterium]